jgi:hypothetical protein
MTTKERAAAQPGVIPGCGAFPAPPAQRADQQNQSARDGITRLRAGSRPAWCRASAGRDPRVPRRRRP